MPLPKIDIDLIRGEHSKRSLKEFIKTFWHIVEPSQPFFDNWHIDCFCDHLTNIDQIKNLLVNVPPSTSKSLTFTVMYPCWRWLTDPSYRFLFASYALSLAERDSVKCRRLIASPLYQKCFGDVFKITSDVDTKRHFENDKTGYRQSISVGSATKGLKGNFICCDDPHDASQAESEIKKAETIAWFEDSFFDRLCNFHKDSRCIIGQRIAKDDLSDFILEHYKQDWTHINIPYEYKSTNFVSCIGWKDPRTEEGQPLNPERFPTDAIRQLKRKAKTFSAQWNQNPIDSANALFHSENFRHYQDTGTEYVCNGKRILKTDCWKLTAVDLAIATHNRADYTVFATANVSRSGEIIVTDIYRDRISGTKIIPRLVEYNSQHQPSYILIEDVAFQRMVLDQARQEGLAVRGVRPDGDKETRSLPLQIRSEQGQVWFSQDASWLSVAETELTEFPNARHDDVVDALSMLAIEVGKRHKVRPEQPSEAPVETYEARMARGLMAGLR
jgi:predicted phage terminase large subunit-like protein